MIESPYHSEMIDTMNDDRPRNSGWLWVIVLSLFILYVLSIGPWWSLFAHGYISGEVYGTVSTLVY